MSMVRVEPCGLFRFDPQHVIQDVSTHSTLYTERDFRHLHSALSGFRHRPISHDATLRQASRVTAVSSRFSNHVPDIPKQ